MIHLTEVCKPFLNKFTMRYFNNLWVLIDTFSVVNMCTLLAIQSIQAPRLEPLAFNPLKQSVVLIIIFNKRVKSFPQTYWN